MVGIYRIYLKKKPEKFYVVGSANIETYMSNLNNDSYTYSLIWTCNKFDLKRYEAHFIEKFKSKEKPVKVLIEEPPEEQVFDVMVETAVIEEPVTEKAVIKQPVKKPRKKKAK